MKKFAIAIAALAIAAVPFTSFADEADVTVDGTAAGQGIYYVDVETTGAFQESNGLTGLQTTATETEDGTIAADTRLA